MKRLAPLLLLALACAPDADRSLMRLDEGWTFAVTERRATPPADGAQWRRNVEHERGRDLWFRHRLPDGLPDDTQLVFRAYVGELSVFVDRQRVYAFRDTAFDGRITLHAVPVARASGPRYLYIRIPEPATARYFGNSFLLASGAQLPYALNDAGFTPLRADFGDIAIGVTLVVIGLVSFGASQLRRRGDTRALLWFGVFAALYGARLLAHSYLPLALGITTRQIAFAGSFITYVITIPGWALAWHLIGEGWKSTLRLQVYAFAALATIGIVTDLVTGRPESLELANNVVVIIGGVNLLFNLFHARRWRSPELRVVLAGSVIFMAFALLNNLAAIGLLPWDETEETLGFLVFVGCLGYAATRSFLRTERERVALEGELATAREIQRSILPTSMPSIEGLRFDAHYDPASSVAGDLYDFLRVDERRIGVMVADVSGHGVPAALIASMVKIAVSSQSRLAHEPASLLREVNRTLRGEVRRAFVTATYLYFDGGTVAVANAGHPAPLLCRGGEIRELGTQGVLLGRFDATYTAEATPLAPGDRIVAYTDGVIEARNARGEELGEERLKAAIRRGASAAEIAREARTWARDQSDADDITLVVIDVILP